MPTDTTDVAAAYGLAGRPFVVVLVVLFAVVLLRSHLFYWVGRAVVRAAQLGQEKIGGPAWWRATVLRMGAFVESRPARRGIALVHRWGPAAVFLAYLTVGVQTAVFVCSGMLRMPYGRFTAASLPGSVAWAAVWATVGLGAVYGAVALATRSPWALVGAVVVVLAAVAALLVGRAHHRRGAANRADSATLPADPAATSPRA